MERKKVSINKIFIVGFIGIILISIINIGKVFAQTDIFKLENAQIKEKSELTEAKINSFDKNSIDSNVTFHKVNDYIIYKLKIKNQDSKDYILKEIKNNNQNEYLEYSYEYDNSFKAKSEREILVKIKYKKEVEELTKRVSLENIKLMFMFEDDKGNEVTKDISINPLTQDKIYIYIGLLVSSIIGIVLTLRRKTNKVLLLPVLLLLLLPIGIKAIESSYDIKIKNSIELYDKLIVKINIDGEEVEKIVKYGETLEEIEAPIKEDYTFEGWYVGEEEFNFEMPITKDLEIEARYRETYPNYKVTYNANGGNFYNEEITKNEVRYKTKPKEVKKYSHTSNINDEGVVSGNYENNLKTKDVISIPGAQSLHVKLTYGTQNNSDYVYIFEDEYINEITNSLSDYKYRYDGSYTSPTTVEFDIEGDTVTFGFYSNASTSYYGYYAEVSSNVKNEPLDTYKEPTKTNKGFKGWYKDANCTEGNEFNKYTDTLTSDIEVYAKWEDGIAMFKKGSSVKKLIKSTAESFLRSNTLPEEYRKKKNIVSDTTSDIPIYMWYDESVKTVKWYSDSTVAYLNPDSSQMFQFKDLRNLSTNGFDTSKVTNMSNMFAYLYYLEELDLSNFNTENVTNMSHMFYGCQRLKELDLSNFNTENVTNMSHMFYGCQIIEKLDVSSFNTENVTDMSWMFALYANSKIEELDLSHFNTENVTDMSWMFWSIVNLTELNVSSFDTNKVTDMSSMFSDLRSIEELDLSHFDTENVTDMNYMFYNCRKLEELDLSHFNTSNVTDMNYMFSGMSSIEELDLSHFNTSNVTDMNHMFSGMSSIEELDLSHFNTSNVTDMSYMFSGMSSIEELDLSHFNTENVTNMARMFEYCESLEELNVSNFNTSNVTDMNAMFMNYYGQELDLSNFNTSKVENMSGMFADAQNLTTIYASPNFVISSNDEYYVDTSGMFYHCGSLVGGEGTEFSTEHDGGDYARIDDQLNKKPGYFTYHYTVVFNANGGSGSMVNQNIMVSRETRLKINKFTRDGYTFAAWNTASDGSGTSYIENVTDIAPLGESITLYAHWVTNDNTYEVIFDKNSDEATGEMENQRIAYGYDAYLSEPTYKREGYKITSWNTMPDGSGQSYGVNDKVNSLTDRGGTITLYAQYIDAVPFAELISGPEINDKLGYYGYHVPEMKKATKEEFEEAEADGYIDYDYGLVSSERSEVPIYMWGDESLGKVYIYTESPIVYLNPDSSHMFEYVDFDIIDTSYFNTSNVTNMSHMFEGSYFLDIIGLDFSNFDTSNVTDMSYMFSYAYYGSYDEYAEKFTLDLSNFDTSNVTDMSYMFSNIHYRDSYSSDSYLELDLSSFNTSNVTDMSNMFNNSGYLEKIYASDSFTVENVDSSDYMFDSCDSLVGGAGTTFDYDYTNKEYARIDNPGSGKPGYFTLK